MDHSDPDALALANPNGHTHANTDPYTRTHTITDADPHTRAHAHPCANVRSPPVDRK